MTDIIKGILQPTVISLQWKIERFFADCNKTGDRYISSMFEICYANKITKWSMSVYPKGNNEQNKDYVSIYLRFHSDDAGAKVKVHYQFSIVSEQNSVYKYINDKDTGTFIGPLKGYGFSRFIEHSAIKYTNKDDALKDDTITIFCEITFHKLDPNVKHSFHGTKWLDEIGNGVGDCEQLLETGNFSDVMLNVQNKKIKSHKAILSCGSPVFEAMFEHDMKEKKESVIDITDINYDVMMELLRYIYSGNVKDIEKLASALIIAADKYQIIGLKALCEKTLYEMLTIDNAVEYLKLTDLCDTIHLKELVIKFAATYHKDIVRKPGFEDLNNKVMHQIMLAVSRTD